jgi:type I pantothenate kinase
MISQKQQDSHFLTRLINAEQNLTNATPPVFILGIAGSVASGKTTLAEDLAKHISSENKELNVKVVSTDSFLYDNKTLENLGLLEEKGFPKSYDYKKMTSFLWYIKLRRATTVPVYSHAYYDIVGEQEINDIDILILEGINTLQNLPSYEKGDISIREFFDYSIYVDVPNETLLEIFLKRFKKLVKEGAGDENSFYYKLAKMDEEEALNLAINVWNTVNKKNLIEHIAPSRKNANLIITKDISHEITGIHAQ